jgi:hypothetical protein
MGTFGGFWRSFEEVKAELRKLQKAKVLKEASTHYGHHYWQAIELEDGRQFISLFLIQGNKRKGFEYKPIDETCGPTYVDCPLSLLEATSSNPPSDAYSVEWRRRVREKHAK